MDLTFLSGTPTDTIAVMGMVIAVLLSLIGWAVWLVFSGRLVARSHLEDAQKTADLFERAWNKSQETQAEFAAQLSRVEELTSTFNHFIESLPKRSRDDLAT